MPWTEDDEAAHDAYQKWVDAKVKVDKSLTFKDATACAKAWMNFTKLYDRACQRGLKIVKLAKRG